MFKKIAKKNPKSLKIKDDQDLEFEAVKNDCYKLIEEIKAQAKIEKTCTTEDKLKVKKIHAEKDRVKEVLDKKYLDLYNKLSRDCQLEWLLCLKMFMQQELKIYRGLEQRVENYAVTNLPLK